MEENIENLDNLNCQESGAKQRSPRASDFERKNSPEAINKEAAELYALREFPNNPRGQELRKKEHLGLLTSEEAEELRRLRQLKRRQETMTPEVQELWRRVEAHDPNVTQVLMNQARFIDVSPSDKQEKVIWTYGLNGCISVVVFGEDKEGRRTAILTHYDQLTSSTINGFALHQKVLEKEIESNFILRRAEHKSVLILAPEGYRKNPETNQWEEIIECKEGVDKLIGIIQEKLGQDVEVQIQPYSTQFFEGAKDQGVLIVRIPPKGQGLATYRTWFSQGKLGKTGEHIISKLREESER